MTLITHRVVCKDGEDIIAKGEYPEIQFSNDACLANYQNFEPLVNMN